MKTKRLRLCLNMIVKNEVANIERCLRSVADHIACWVIADTGSTDGTQAIIRNFFAERRLAGELHEFPFVTFDQARNRALDLARGSHMRFDYILFADADMELKVYDRGFAERLTADVYLVKQDSGIAYWNARLLKRDAAARYVGVTHEYLDLKAGVTENLEAVSYIDHASGANRPGKFARDAGLLARALDTEADPLLRARYTFYLANSLRDDGDHSGALASFRERARMGGWPEEVFVSRLNAAQMSILLKHAADEVIAAFEVARDALPSRAPEALHGAARYCREHGLHDRGFRLAERARDMPVPHAGLFVAEWVYRYGLLDELAINAYWSDRFSECVAACDQLLAEPTLPADDRARVMKNRAFAVDRLDQRRRSARASSDRFSELLGAARLSEADNESVEEVVAAYLDALEAGPDRVEALHGASRFCRYKKLHERGYALAMQGISVLATSRARTPEEGWIYDYGLLDELAVHAYWSGHDEEAVKACDRLLDGGLLPLDMRDRVSQNRRFSLDRLASRRSAEASTNVVRAPGHDTGPASPGTRIPEVFHFVIGLDEVRDERPFSLAHYLAVKSALVKNPTFSARVYYYHEPFGPYWDLLARDVFRIPVTAPREVFGRPVAHFAHRADVLRMQLMLDHGGIYMDFDTICQRSFAALLDGRVVLGREEVPDGRGGRHEVGLCNATIIAPPGAEFMRLWYESYRDFVGGTSGDLWNKFSVQVPMTLLSENPRLVRMEPASSFFWPSWTEEGIGDLFERDLHFPEAYSFHLWQSKSGEKLSRLTIEDIFSIDTTYNRVAREVIPPKLRETAAKGERG